MRLSYQFMALIAVAFLLMSCSTTGKSNPTRVATNFIYKQNVVATTTQHYPSKNPQKVAFYDKKEPHTAYRVIGVATVSKYNLLGMQRKELTLQEMMKKLAASIGGDGLIDIKTNQDSIQANVIAFQKILI